MNEDRFADFLDAMVGGTAPDTASPSTDIARRLQESATDRLDGDRRSAIWRNLMSDHAGTTSTNGGPGPLTQPALTAPDAFNPWVRRRVPSLPKRSRIGIVHEAMQTGITAMAIVAVMIAAFVAFPILRGDEATPRVTPTAWAAVPTTSALVFGSPESPATPSATYHHPQPNECKVEPLTIDEVMAVINGGSPRPLDATPTGMTPRAITEEEYQQIRESHRTWLACHFNGTAFQMLTLETDDMIRDDVLRNNLPAYSPSLVTEQIESLDTDASSDVNANAFMWDPPTDTYIPMIADWDPDAAPVMDERGQVTVTIVWMNRDGDVIAGDPEIPIENDLPVHWTYVWSEASGQWLLNSYGS